MLGAGLSPSKPQKVNEYLLEFDISFIQFTSQSLGTEHTAGSSKPQTPPHYPGTPQTVSGLILALYFQ